MSLKFCYTSGIVLLFFANSVLSKPTNVPGKIFVEKTDESMDNNIIRTASRWERSMDLLGQIMDALRIGRGRLVNFAMMARNIIAERAEEFTSEASNKVIAVLAAREAKKIIQDAEAKKKSQQMLKKNDTMERKKSAEVVTKIAKKVEVKQPIKRSATDAMRSTPITTSPISDFFPPKTRENVRLESEGGQSLLEIRKNKNAEKFLQSFGSPTPLVDRITEEEKYGNSGDKFIGIGRALVNGFEGLSNFLNTLVDIPVNAAKKTSRGLTAALNQVGGKLIGLE